MRCCALLTVTLLWHAPFACAPTVVIWQGSGGAGHDIGFMYRPIVDTLLDGLAAAPDSMAKVMIRSGAGRAGLQLALVQKPALGVGDWFVWIGHASSQGLPWSRLQAAGVRTVFYNTEPLEFCVRRGSDEVWDYSWHNIDVCRRRAPKDVNLTLRYVPPGFAAPVTTQLIVPERAVVRPTAELMLFGYPYFKSGRARCYERLGGLLGGHGRLNATFTIWSAAAFERWWHEVGQWTTHLSLHKRCRIGGMEELRSHEPLEAVRLSALLSRGASLLSEHSYARDEQVSGARARPIALRLVEPSPHLPPLGQLLGARPSRLGRRPSLLCAAFSAQEYAGLVRFGTLDEMPALLKAAQQARSRTTDRNAWRHAR